ncbi:MAG TPA: DMT family transporter [Burkholderiaceae bacterium]|nr:DMT family transporter [Burkholderiaceae bacterium]
MRTSDLIELIALAAIWGASFLFMRLGAAEFGPLALSMLRVAGATLFLLPLLAWQRQTGTLRTHWRELAVVGVINSVCPFVLFSIAALALNAGLSSIFNATAPLWGALIGTLWLKDRLTPSRMLGLAIGFAGVLFLAWDKASFKPGEHGVSAGLAILACLLATLCYGFGANYTKRKLQGTPPLAVAAGSQLAATVVLALPGAWAWPATPPSATAWGAVLGLALLATGVAYLLYFRLIAHVGPARAISVTYLIPLFGVLWGALFLGESVTPAMLVGGAIILVGTALVTGVVQLPARAARSA